MTKKTFIHCIFKDSTESGNLSYKMGSIVSTRRFEIQIAIATRLQIVNLYHISVLSWSRPRICMPTVSKYWPPVMSTHRPQPTTTTTNRSKLQTDSTVGVPCRTYR